MKTAHQRFPGVSIFICQAVYICDYDYGSNPGPFNRVCLLNTSGLFIQTQSSVFYYDAAWTGGSSLVLIFPFKLSAWVLSI